MKNFTLSHFKAGIQENNKGISRSAASYENPGI